MNRKQPPSTASDFTAGAQSVATVMMLHGSRDQKRGRMWGAQCEVGVQVGAQSRASRRSPTMIMGVRGSQGREFAPGLPCVAAELRQRPSRAYIQPGWVGKRSSVTPAGEVSDAIGRRQ